MLSDGKSLDWLAGNETNYNCERLRKLFFEVERKSPNLTHEPLFCSRLVRELEII